jgi:hypothetical protein
MIRIDKRSITGMGHTCLVMAFFAFFAEKADQCHSYKVEMCVSQMSIPLVLDGASNLDGPRR